MKKKTNKVVTSIVFSNNRGYKERFVLAGHREAMERMEDKMYECGCAPTLVVSKHNPVEWWVDDISFLGDLLGVDELMTGDIQVNDEPVVKFLEASLELKEGESAEFRVKGKDLVIRAAASTMPCDESTGLYTNDCSPVEL